MNSISNIEKTLFQQDNIYSEKEIISLINKINIIEYKKDIKNELIEYSIENIEYVQGEYYRGIKYQFKKENENYTFVKYQDIENMVFNPLNLNIKATIFIFVIIFIISILISNQI